MFECLVRSSIFSIFENIKIVLRTIVNEYIFAIVVLPSTLYSSVVFHKIKSNKNVKKRPTVEANLKLQFDLPNPKRFVQIPKTCPLKIFVGLILKETSIKII